MRFLSALVLALAFGSPLTAAPPNVVVILADDVGYGDLGCYGATKVRTPNLDRLAAAGMHFTDSHSPAAVCTPTRYSIMTGQYAWRHPPGAHILSGVAPLSIKPGTVTLPSFLKANGYATAAVGKWHLGLGEKETDYNGVIKPGAHELGFDSSFPRPATARRASMSRTAEPSATIRRIPFASAAPPRSAMSRPARRTPISSPRRSRATGTT